MIQDSVVVILYNSNNKILLQLRTDDAYSNPSKWGIFGGAVEKSEDKLKAIERETFEELGYHLNNPKLVYGGVIPFNEKVYPFNGKFYVYAEKYDSSQKLQLNEGKAMKWFYINELNNIDMIDFQREIILNLSNILFNK